jgi:hypothetical protein
MVVRRMLARDPNQRYPTAEHALVDLLEAPGARQSTSLDLKAYLASLGIASLPAVDARIATMPGRPWGTGTLAGQVSKSLPARLNRFFGKKRVLVSLFLLAAASVTAALTIYPDTPKPKPVALPAPTPDAGAPVKVAAVDPPVVAAPPPQAPAPPRKTTVTIEVAPAEAKVEIDGRAQPGAPPYRVEAEPGATLAVHAELAGHQAVDRNVHVGAEAVAETIELAPLPSPPVATRKSGPPRNIPRQRPKTEGKEPTMPTQPALEAKTAPPPPRPPAPDNTKVYFPEDVK